MFRYNLGKGQTFKGRAIAHASLCQICDGQSGTGTSFSTDILIFSCGYHFFLWVPFYQNSIRYDSMLFLPEGEKKG
jgi:hypothetical protein